MRATPSDDAQRPGSSQGGRHAAPDTNPLPESAGPRWSNTAASAPATQPTSPVPTNPIPTSPVPAGPEGPGGSGEPPSGGDGQRPSSGGSNRKLLGAGAVLVVLVLIGVIFAVTRGSGDDKATSATPTASASATPAATTGTKYGVFRQTSKSDVASYEQWLGAKVSYVVDFGARQTWNDIADPQYLLDEWKDSDYRLVYAVPMLPGDKSATLQEGAQGAYNDYFKTLAENLVKNGQEDAVLRVGWEFNLGTWIWGSEDSTSWKAYYRNIVTTMRSVSGAKFEFDWNVNGGPNKYDAADYYPGDDVVDYVGVDAYDVSGAGYPYPANCDSACYVAHEKKAWDASIYGGERGLKYWSQFAKDHGKPLTLPEWGVWGRPDGIGGSDDPDYIQRMYDFITDKSNNVAYASYFEYDYPSDSDGGKHSLEDSFPNSAAKFKQLFVPLYTKALGS